MCLIQKFNGSELLRSHLNNEEKQDFVPIDIIYEPTLNTNKPIFCFYAPSIHLVYHTTYEKIRSAKKYLTHMPARQCPYCNNFFIKNLEKMQKHVSCCAGKAGFNFSFHNGKIIDYQDRYKNLG